MMTVNLLRSREVACGDVGDSGASKVGQARANVSITRLTNNGSVATLPHHLDNAPMRQPMPPSRPARALIYAATCFRELSRI